MSAAGVVDTTWAPSAQTPGLPGALDSSYGDGGRVAVDMLGGRHTVGGGGAYLQPDGRIVGIASTSAGAGATQLDSVLFRLASSGPAAQPPGSYVSLPPTRILDTRSGNGAAAGAVPGGGSVDLQVAGRGGVPASGAGAAVMNVTVTQPTWDGSLVVYPGGTTPPLASNLNFTPGTTIPATTTWSSSGTTPSRAPFT